MRTVVPLAVLTGSLAGLLAVAVAPATAAGRGQAAHYRYRTVHVSTASGRVTASDVGGVTGAGAIVGNLDASGTKPARVYIQATRGHAKQVKVKGYPDTFLGALSNNGTLVVDADVPRTRRVATYLRRPSGALKRLALPGTDPTSVAVVGVNDHGAMVAVGFSGGQSRSWVSRHGHFRVYAVKVKSAVTTATEGIDNAGDIVGSYEDANGVSHGFIDRHGRVQVVNLPKAGTSADRGSQIQSITNSGLWVGAATPDSDGARVIDYVHRPGRPLVRVSFPKEALTTIVSSINASGEIGGLYRVGDLTKGFVAKPLG
jgi:hypothetical protein